MNAFDLAKEKYPELYEEARRSGLPMCQGYLCHRCGARAQHRCQGCGMAWYCGRECQREHFSQHRQLCGVSVQNGGVGGRFGFFDVLKRMATGSWEGVAEQENVRQTYVGIQDLRGPAVDAEKETGVELGVIDQEAMEEAAALAEKDSDDDPGRAASNLRKAVSDIDPNLMPNKDSFVRALNTVENDAPSENPKRAARNPEAEKDPKSSAARQYLELAWETAVGGVRWLARKLREFTEWVGEKVLGAFDNIQDLMSQIAATVCDPEWAKEYDSEGSSVGERWLGINDLREIGFYVVRAVCMCQMICVNFPKFVRQFAESKGSIATHFESALGILRDSAQMYEGHVWKIVEQVIGQVAQYVIRFAQRAVEFGSAVKSRAQLALASVQRLFGISEERLDQVAARVEGFVLWFSDMFKKGYRWILGALVQIASKCQGAVFGALQALDPRQTQSGIMATEFQEFERRARRVVSDARSIAGRAEETEESKGDARKLLDLADSFEKSLDAQIASRSARSLLGMLGKMDGLEDLVICANEGQFAMARAIMRGYDSNAEESYAQAKALAKFAYAEYGDAATKEGESFAGQAPDLQAYAVVFFDVGKSLMKLEEAVEVVSKRIQRIATTVGGKVEDAFKMKVSDQDAQKLLLDEEYSGDGVRQSNMQYDLMKTTVGLALDKLLHAPIKQGYEDIAAKAVLVMKKIQKALELRKNRKVDLSVASQDVVDYVDSVKDRFKQTWTRYANALNQLPTTKLQVPRKAYERGYLGVIIGIQAQILQQSIALTFSLLWQQVRQKDSAIAAVVGETKWEERVDSVAVLYVQNALRLTMDGLPFVMSRSDLCDQVDRVCDEGQQMYQEAFRDARETQMYDVLLRIRRGNDEFNRDNIDDVLKDTFRLGEELQRRKAIEAIGRISSLSDVQRGMSRLSHQQATMRIFDKLRDSCNGAGSTVPSIEETGVVRMGLVKFTWNTLKNAFGMGQLVELGIKAQAALVYALIKVGMEWMRGDGDIGVMEFVRKVTWEMAKFASGLLLTQFVIGGIMQLAARYPIPAMLQSAILAVILGIFVKRQIGGS